MPFQRPNNLRPIINKETGEVEEVNLIETDSQRQRRLSKEARLRAEAEQRERDRTEGKRKKREEQKYMPDAYPWESIHHYFVRGAPDKNGTVHYPTLKDICSHFLTSENIVRKRMLEEGWIQERDQWQLSLQKHVQKVTMIDYVEAASKFDASCIEAAQYAVDEILNKFRIAKVNQEQIDNLDLDRLGRAIVNWQRVGRLSLGLSTDNTATKLETKSGDAISSIDLSKLTTDEMEQMKLLLQKATEREEQIVEAQVIELKPEAVIEDKMSDTQGTE